MKHKKNIFRKTRVLLFSLFITTFIVSCVGDELFREDLPDSNSKIDTVLPEANFSYSPDEDDFTLIHFQDLSSESNTYSWDFGTGDISTERDPSYTFADGEGTYPVTLTTGDSNGVMSSITINVLVVEPELPDVLDPVLVNADFDKLPKSSGSDCSCAGWINKDIGEQGESSSGNGGSDNVVKFDNNEPDHVYQEFEITPNADYLITIVSAFQSSTGGPFPSMLELRILAGSGYVDGYTPVYYTETVDFPQEDWGYTTISQVEDPANNLLVQTIDHPGNTDYNSYTYTFNAGANNSVALFVRGVGGDSIGEFLYTGGDEEVRADYVTITAIN